MNTRSPRLYLGPEPDRQAAEAKAVAALRRHRLREPPERRGSRPAHASVGTGAGRAGNRTRRAPSPTPRGGLRFARWPGSRADGLGAATMIVCLGEALVDLICERPVGLAHRGGLVHARTSAARSPTSPSPPRRTGAPVALAGAAGDDEWGRWLAERLEREGVDLSWFELLEGEQTPIAFATFDADGEPSFQIYGDAVEVAVGAVAPRLDDALERRHGAGLQLDHPGDRGRARGHPARARAGARARRPSLLRPQHPPEPLGRRPGPGGARLARAGRRFDPGARQPRRGDRDRRRRRSTRGGRRARSRSAPSSRWSPWAPRAR